MKKLGLLVLVAGIILMAGCAGDDPAGPTGDLPTVEDLDILATSSGRTVNLSWDAVTSTDVDGYKLYFREEETGTWAEIDDVTITTATHNATASGYYAVKAYEGSNYSESNSNVVNTMPNMILTNYTIWDNHAPTTDDSGFRFGANSGETCQASTSNDHDIYCFDGTWEESPCGFYSGDLPPFGGGTHTDMIDAEGTYGYPEGTEWWNDGYIKAGDVIFCELHTGYYVKVYVSAIPQHPTQPLSHGITFNFDYQPIEGLYLFTTDSN